MHLPDVNVWLALAFESHADHKAAAVWFDRAAVDGCAFCRVTQQGFLRLATNPAAFAEEALTCTQAWSVYDQFLADPRIVFAAEPAAIESAWREYSSPFRYSPKIWTDAYLAAFARCADLKLVTLHPGMTQYRGVKCIVLG